MTLRDAHLRDRSGALVLAVRGPDGQFVTNPSPDARIDPHHVLIAIGTEDELATLGGIVARREAPCVRRPGRAAPGTRRQRSGTARRRGVDPPRGVHLDQRPRARRRFVRRPVERGMVHPLGHQHVGVRRDAGAVPGRGSGRVPPAGRPDTTRGRRRRRPGRREVGGGVLAMERRLGDRAHPGVDEVAHRGPEVAKAAAEKRRTSAGSSEPAVTCMPSLISSRTSTRHVQRAGESRGRASSCPRRECLPPRSRTACVPAPAGR